MENCLSFNPIQHQLLKLKYEEGLDEGKKSMAKVAKFVFAGEPVAVKFEALSNRKKKRFFPDQIYHITSGTSLDDMDYSLLSRLLLTFGDQNQFGLYNLVKDLIYIRNEHAHTNHIVLDYKMFYSKMNVLLSLCISILQELKSYSDPAAIHSLDHDINNLENKFSLLIQASEYDNVQLKIVNQQMNIKAKLEEDKLMTKLNARLEEIQKEFDEKLREATSRKRDEGYSNNRGRILFFNVLEFDDSLKLDKNIKNRIGAEVDSVTLRDTFAIEHFHGKYTVDVFESKTYEETLEICENLRNDISLIGFESLIIFISSHGESKNYFYTKNKKMHINEIRCLFLEHTRGCSFLKGNAKVFFANYCQGDGEESSDFDFIPSIPDSDSIPSIPDFDSLMVTEGNSNENKKIIVPQNMKTIYSTSDGMAAYREPNGGNYFLQTFCRILKANPNLELNNLIYKINAEVENEIGCKNTFSQDGSSFQHFWF